MGNVKLANLKLNGGRKINNKNVNAKLSVYSTGTIDIDSLDYSGCDGAYNGLEVNLGSKTYTGASNSVTIKNTTFKNLTNNAISVFQMATSGVVNIENCVFEMADGGEMLRLSNYTNTSYTVNIKDCTIIYKSRTTENDEKFNFPILFENYNPDAAEDNTKTQISKIVVNFVNTTIDSENITADNAWITTYDPASGGCVFLTDKPTIFVDGEKVA